MEPCIRWTPNPFHAGKKQFTGVSPAGSNPGARNGGCNYKRGCVAAMRPFTNLLWTLVVLRCRFCRRDWSAWRSEVPARWTIPEPPVAIRVSALLSLIHWIHPFTEAISPPCFHSLNSENFHPFLYLILLAACMDITCFITLIIADHTAVEATSFSVCSDCTSCVFPQFVAVLRTSRCRLRTWVTSTIIYSAREQDPSPSRTGRRWRLPGVVDISGGAGAHASRTADCRPENGGRPPRPRPTVVTRSPRPRRAPPPAPPRHHRRRRRRRRWTQEFLHRSVIIIAIIVVKFMLLRQSHTHTTRMLTLIEDRGETDNVAINAITKLFEVITVNLRRIWPM